MTTEDEDNIQRVGELMALCKHALAEVRATGKMPDVVRDLGAFLNERRPTASERLLMLMTLATAFAHSLGIEQGDQLRYSDTQLLSALISVRTGLNADDLRRSIGLVGAMEEAAKDKPS